MGKKLVTAQGAFTMLVPGLTAPTDPSSNTPPTGDGGMTYRTQFFPDVPGKGEKTQPTSGKTPGTSTRTGLMTYETQNVAVPGRVDISITDIAGFDPADWPILGPTFFHLGQYVIEQGVDFDIGANAPDTADNLAAFIDSFPDWSCAASGTGTVRANGPTGIVGNEVVVYVSGPGASLWTLETIGGADPQGRMHDADPTIGPPEIT